MQEVLPPGRKCLSPGEEGLPSGKSEESVSSGRDMEGTRQHSGLGALVLVALAQCMTVCGCSRGPYRHMGPF